MRDPRYGLTVLAVPVHARHSNIDRLRNALDDGDELTARLAGKRLAGFLDYDRTLTPIAADHAPGSTQEVERFLELLGEGGR